MKKGLIFILFISAVRLVVAQIVLQENFTGYLATTQTIPSGWTFSYQGNYTTSTFSGNSGPNAYKFGVNNATINTPAFQQGADSIKFWIKGSSTDSISKLVILESADSINWDTLATMRPLPTMAAKGKRSLPVKSTSEHLRFKYVKSAGNVAFDDFILLKQPSVADFTSDVVNGCETLCVNFQDKSMLSVKNWNWDFGDGQFSTMQNPNHCYIGAGSYTVKLTVDTGNSSVSTSKLGYIKIYSFPTSSFSFSPATIYTPNPTITFTDNSIGASAWLWNFNDPVDAGTSVLQNPAHTYSDTGTYCTMLIVTSANGCMDTTTNCFKILPGTLSVVNTISDNFHFSIYPNPSADGLFNVHLSFGNISSVLTIYNVIGETIKTIETENQTELIDLSDIKTGIYFVKVNQGGGYGIQKISITK